MHNIASLFNDHKELHLQHRYITYNHISELIKNLADNFSVNIIGKSVMQTPIHSIVIGTGKKRILLWSQMHGNESTTTKALFDLFNSLKSSSFEHILSNCQLCVIPLLNPDGAKTYTRENANGIDLNRDAQNMSQPESRALRAVFDEFKPHFCFNLHGQRTIYGAGETNFSATISFLAPSQDQKRSFTNSRKKAMQVIRHMNSTLQDLIPNQVGRYDDSFNLNCVGDTFQSLGAATILFEAGHYQNDYAREITRKHLFVALVVALDYIGNNTIMGDEYQLYLDIPENNKCFYDIIIRNAKLDDFGITDLAIQYEETLFEDRVKFIPILTNISDLTRYYGHKEIDAKGQLVSFPGSVLKENTQIDKLIIGVEEFSLNLPFS